MEIILNGKPVQTPHATLRALLRGGDTNTVVILNGYQTAEDLPLSPGDRVTLIPKGRLPDPEALEAMLAARMTPGVYERLRAARVGIAGLGGLGSRIALDLARSGVGCLHLVDFDEVEPSNLNRQQYRIAHLGMPKTQALRAQIAEVAPGVRVLYDAVRVTAENAPALFREDPVVCEAFDAPDAKAALVNALLARAPDTVVVASSGMAGAASANLVRTGRPFRRLYVCGDQATESAPGVGLMAPRVAVCAGHQANMVLRLILGEEEP